MHDATKVLLGSTRSSDKDVTCYTADPAVFLAGKAVRQNTSTGAIQVAASGAGPALGVSLGASLDDTAKISVVRTGNEVPLVLDLTQAFLVVDDITFTAKAGLWGTAGEAITIQFANTLDDGTAEVVYDPDEPYAIVVAIETAVTTQGAIRDAIEAHEFVSELVDITLAAEDEDTAAVTKAETPLDGGVNIATVGAQVSLDDTSGHGGADTATGAVYLTGPLNGVYPDGTVVPVALIAMPGGL